MAEKCVKIEVDEQGQVTVGLEPPESEQQASQGEEGAEQSYMKPAQSIDQALQVAKDLLTNQQAQQAQAGPDAEAQMAQGFKQGMGQPAGFGARA